MPWVNQARAAIPQGTWQNSDANKAETETPARLDIARQVGDSAIVMLKNSKATAKDGSTGKLLPLRVPPPGTPFKVAVMGYFANPAQMYLGDYSSAQGVFGTANEVNPYQGIKAAIQAVDPEAVVTDFPGVTGGDEAADLTQVDPASVTAAGQYNDVIVVVGTDASTGTEGAGPGERRAAGGTGLADPAGRGPEPQHDRLHGDGRHGRRQAVRERRPGDAVELLQRDARGPVACRRGTRSV